MISSCPMPGDRLDHGGTALHTASRLQSGRLPTVPMTRIPTGQHQQAPKLAVVVMQSGLVRLPQAIDLAEREVLSHGLAHHARLERVGQTRAEPFGQGYLKAHFGPGDHLRSEEHTSELQS